MLSDDKRDDINESINEIADIMKEKGISTLSKDGGVVKLANSFGTIGSNMPFDTSMYSPSEEERELQKKRLELIEEVGQDIIKSPEEIAKEQDEAKQSAKLQAYIQLAQLGGDVLAADPSRGTLAAVGQAVSKAGPEFAKIAEDYKKIGRGEKEKRTKEKLQQLELLDKKSESMKEQRMEDLAIQKTISEIQENLLTAASQGGYTTSKQQDDILAGGKQMFKLAGEELGFEYDEATKQFVNIPGITTKGTKADATDLAAEASRIYADGIRNRQLVDAIDIFQKVARRKYPKNPGGGTGGTGTGTGGTGGTGTGTGGTGTGTGTGTGGAMSILNQLGLEPD